jgi:hypothetical protein
MKTKVDYPIIIKDFELIGKLSIGLELITDPNVLHILGIGDQEVNNIIGQRFQEILETLGVTEGNGL